MTTEKFFSKDVAVLGFGRSGRAVADFLLPLGARLTVYAATEPQGTEPYRARGVRFRVGDFPARFPEEILVRSPVIRPDIPSIAASVRAGAVLTSETELLMERCPATVIGVTGSDGKTTTAALTAALLRGAGRRVYLGGNNGVPLLAQVGEMTDADCVVLELSSFQLMTLDRAPHVAVMTNVTPNHLNWHTDMAEYMAAKCRILGERTAFFVTNFDCAATRALAARSACPYALFSSSALPPEGHLRLGVAGDRLKMCHNGDEKRLSLADFRLPGRHNLENLMAAVAATAAVLKKAPSLAALAEFHGVPHRLQYVDTVDGVKYINSSIDTSPTRTAAALSALDGHPIVIAGGRGKGVSLLPLATALSTHAKAVFLYGETADEIAALMKKTRPVYGYFAFGDAFAAAAAYAAPGDTVLLSPGCTAFDQFRDFEHRGATFCDMVAKWKGTKRV